MNKCPNCGTEYEGGFCPECGPDWLKKSCPNCGTRLPGSARFCNNCGYSFATSSLSASEKQGGALVWVKGHKKLVVVLSIVLAMVIALTVTLPIVLLNRYNGTYCLYAFEQFDEKQYFKLSGRTWTNEDGDSGTFKLKGDKITFYQEDLDLNINMEFASGTLKDGIITLGVEGMKMIYVKKSAVHVHEYKKWTVVTHSTCTVQGVEQSECKCGKTETRPLPLAEHKLGAWQIDGEKHWQICTACNRAINNGRHIFHGNACSSCGLPAQGSTGLTFQKHGDGYIVTGLGNGKGPIIRIPAQNGGLPVTAIWDEAFRGCDGLTNVVIPDSVTSIGTSAFEDCSRLSNIEIPNSVASIGDRAFEDCSGLKTVTIGSKVTSIGFRAFRGCSGLESVTIGNRVTDIEDRAFEACDKLKSVYYMGTSNKWMDIKISPFNSDLTTATRYYYSEEENYDGSHWHYDPATSLPTPWKKENQ